MTDLEIEKLSIDERLELISRLWDSMPAKPDDLPVPEWHLEIIQQRLERADEHPEEGFSVEEVRQKLAGRAR